MAGADNDNNIDQGRLDLVPMIDCIMLLLIFFVMTTKFSSEEKAISSLLPTDKGQAAGRSTAAKTETVNICIYPTGMTRNHQPSDYVKRWNEMVKGRNVFEEALLRVGQRDPVQVQGTKLREKKSAEMVEQVEIIHKYVTDALAAFEKPGAPRKEQRDVVIHCFSGLPWKFALVAYDAVRSYEGNLSNLKYTGNPEELKEARPVTFAPPRVRNYSSLELGDELYEIVHMK